MTVADVLTGNIVVSDAVAVTVGPVNDRRGRRGRAYTVAEERPWCSTPPAAAHDNPAESLTYQWDLDGDGLFGELGPDAARGDEWGTRPVFSAAGLDGPTSVTVRLRVFDPAGTYGEQAASIEVTNEPHHRPGLQPTVDWTGFTGSGVPLVIRGPTHGRARSITATASVRSRSRSKAGPSA